MRQMGGARLKKHAYSFDEINNLRPCVLNCHVWWPFLGILKEIVMQYLIKNMLSQVFPR